MGKYSTDKYSSKYLEKSTKVYLEVCSSKFYTINHKMFINIKKSDVFHLLTDIVSPGKI